MQDRFRRHEETGAEQITRLAQAVVIGGLKNKDGLPISSELNPALAERLTKSERRPKLGSAARPHGHAGK